MTVIIPQPISQASRELLLRDIEAFTRSAEYSDERAQAAFEKSDAIRASAEEYAREAQEYRDRIADSLRVIALIDNHNLTFQPKEN